MAAAYSPDGTRLASASRDRAVRLWDAADGQLIAEYRHEAGAFCVAFSPDGRWLASGGGDGRVRFAAAADGRAG
jgi:WD40 repeat protein